MWSSGNAEVDGAAERGWLIGHFLAQRAPERTTNSVEVKWGKHQPGEGRTEWAPESDLTSLSILVNGWMRVIFRSTSVDLVRQGDYVLWDGAEQHRWVALGDQPTTVVTVRWPIARDIIS